MSTTTVTEGKSTEVLPVVVDDSDARVTERITRRECLVLSAIALTFGYILKPDSGKDLPPNKPLEGVDKLNIPRHIELCLLYRDEDHARQLHYVCEQAFTEFLGSISTFRNVDSNIVGSTLLQIYQNAIGAFAQVDSLYASTCIKDLENKQKLIDSLVAYRHEPADFDVVMDNEMKYEQERTRIWEDHHHYVSTH